MEISKEDLSMSDEEIISDELIANNKYMVIPGELITKSSEYMR